MNIVTERDGDNMMIIIILIGIGLYLWWVFTDRT